MKESLSCEKKKFDFQDVHTGSGRTWSPKTSCQRSHWGAIKPCCVGPRHDKVNMSHAVSINQGNLLPFLPKKIKKKHQTLSVCLFILILLAELNEKKARVSFS